MVGDPKQDVVAESVGTLAAEFAQFCVSYQPLCATHCRFRSNLNIFDRQRCANLDSYLSDLLRFLLSSINLHGSRFQYSQRAMQNLAQNLCDGRHFVANFFSCACLDARTVLGTKVLFHKSVQKRTGSETVQNMTARTLDSIQNCGSGERIAMGRHSSWSVVGVSGSWSYLTGAGNC